MIVAVAIAGISIYRMNNKKESNAVQETTTVEQTTVEQITEEPTTEEAVTDSNADSSIDVSVPDDFYGTDLEPIKVKYPDDEIMALVDNDFDGINKTVQEFNNVYGWGNALYAMYADEIQMDTQNQIVTLTYYIKRKNRYGKYFYCQYDKKTKEWIYIPG